MKAIRTAAPFIHENRSVRSAMQTVSLCLCFIVFFSAFIYGPRVLLLSVLSVAACIVSESVIAFLTHLPNTVSDCSAIVTGLILTMLMPVTIPVYILVIAAAFAIFLCKGVFGGLGHNPFNPAACAFAFVTVSWPSKVFLYAPPFQSGPSETAEAVRTVTSAASYLKDSGLPPFRMIDALLGAVPSAMGAVSFFVLLGCFVFLCAKKIIRWKITVSFILSCLFFAALFNRTGNWKNSAFWELFSGFLLFAAVFMLTDPATSPKSGAGCWLYGALCGLSVIAMRIFGAYEEGLCFALILCNAVAPAIDRMALSLNSLKWRKQRRPG